MLLLWSSLGFKLSWAKGARGRALDWIGARYALESTDGSVHAVVVTITAEKCRKLHDTVTTLLQNPMLERKAVRELAGLAG